MHMGVILQPSDFSACRLIRLSITAAVRDNPTWVGENNIRFTFLLPVKRSGSYYVLAAVKDMASEKMASAYQFVEIPDLKKKQLVL